MALHKQIILLYRYGDVNLVESISAVRIDRFEI